MAVRNNPKVVTISPQAKEDITNILSYLTLNWNQEVVDEFLQKLETFYFIVSVNPRLWTKPGATPTAALLHKMRNNNSRGYCRIQRLGLAKTGNGYF